MESTGNTRNRRQSPLIGVGREIRAQGWWLGVAGKRFRLKYVVAKTGCYVNWKAVPFTSHEARDYLHSLSYTIPAGLEIGERMTTGISDIMRERQHDFKTELYSTFSRSWGTLKSRRSLHADAERQIILFATMERSFS